MKQYSPFPILLSVVSAISNFFAISLTAHHGDSAQEKTEKILDIGKATAFAALAMVNCHFLDK